MREEGKEELFGLSEGEAQRERERLAARVLISLEAEQFFSKIGSFRR